MARYLRMEGYKTLEDKLNFFIDNFNLLHKYSGKHRLWEYETPRSLIEKVIFQLEHNPRRGSQYIVHYLGHTQLDPNQKHIKKFRRFKSLHRDISMFLNSPEQQKELMQSGRFLNKFYRLRQELADNQFDYAFDQLVVILRCQHTLPEHLLQIRNLTAIIYAELKYARRPDRRIRSLMRDIFSNNVYSFPVPPELANKSHYKNYKKMRENYIKRLTIEQCLEGIRSFKNYRNIEGFYLLRIRKLRLDVQDVLSFNRLEIRSPANPKFKKLGKQTKYGIVWKDFLDTDDFSVSIVPGSLLNYDHAKANAIAETERVVQYLNSRLNFNCYVDPYTVLNTEKFEEARFDMTRDDTVEKLSERSIEVLDADNAFQRLRGIDSKAKQHILSIEYMYQKALGSGDLWDYWHYLESLFPKDQRQNKQVLSLWSDTLIVHFRKTYSDHLAEVLFNQLHSLSTGKDNAEVTYKEINALTANWRPSDIVKLSRKHAKHPIIRFILEIYDNRFESSILKKERQYYHNVAIELYALRNSVVHGGISNSFSELMLRQIVPVMTYRIRDLVLHFVSQGRYKSMNGIISMIQRHAEELMY